LVGDTKGAQATFRGVPTQGAPGAVQLTGQQAGTRAGQTASRALPHHPAREAEGAGAEDVEPVFRRDRARGASLCQRLDELGVVVAVAVREVPDRLLEGILDRCLGRDEIGLCFLRGDVGEHRMGAGVRANLNAGTLQRAYALPAERTL